MLQVVMCCSLSSLLVCDAHRISLLLVRNVQSSCGKGCASVRVPEPLADWEAWVEVAVELFLLVQQLPLFLGHHPVHPRILPHDQLSVLPHRPNCRQTVAANQATDHTSQDLNSTFPLLLPSQAHKTLGRRSAAGFQSGLQVS